MKTKKTTRIATVLLSLLLAFVCFASSVCAIPITATAASNNKSKPTYTDTLNKNNELISKYTETLEKNSELLEKLDKKENKALKQVKENGKNWVSLAFDVVKSAINASGDDEQYEVEDGAIIKGIITSVAGIWGFDGVASTLFEEIESLFDGKNYTTLDEIQNLSYDIDDHFNEISDHLYDIENQLGALSNQVTLSVYEISEDTRGQIENMVAKDILRAFMSSGFEGFSYLEYSNYLYGNDYGNDTPYVNSSEAYYILLLESIANNEDEQLIEHYYNKLFESIYDNIHTYNQYYYGEVTGLDKSIAAYYYDYISYNPELVNSNSTIEYEALLFALDLYTTYVYSYEILEMCYAYQTTCMLLDPSMVAYEYAPGKVITNDIIEHELEKMQVNLILAEEQVAEDIAYILGMENSYIVIDNESGEIHNIGNYGNSFGNIAQGQTIYMNVIPDKICDLFLLNKNNFHYYVNGAEYSGSTSGIITPPSKDEFTVSVRYNNCEIYKIDFTNIDYINNSSPKAPILEFSGGLGTPEEPYLISNAAQYSMIYNDLNAHYKLISDISLSGVVYSPIGTYDDPFNGTFDGNGYTISNLAIESLIYDNKNITLKPTTGMFGTIGKDGVVKNLTLESISVTSDYNKDYISPEHDNSEYRIGGIAGYNKGVISNCTIIGNSKIYVHRVKDSQNSKNVYIYVAGISGENWGNINYCTIDNLSIDASSYHNYYAESADLNKHGLYVAGIAAKAENSISNCRVSERTTISAYAKSIAATKKQAVPYLTVHTGGIVGDESCKEYINNVYSNCTIVNCMGEIDNVEDNWWRDYLSNKSPYTYDKSSVKAGYYYPVAFPLSNIPTIENIWSSYLRDFYYDEFNRIYRGYEIQVHKENNDSGYQWGPDSDIVASPEESAEATKRTHNAFKSNLLEKYQEAEKNVLTVLNGKIASDYNDPIFTLNKEKKAINIELTDTLCEINAKYLTEHLYKVIDVENDVKNVQFVDNDGSVVDAKVIGYYGFDTYHESFENQFITVTVLFSINGTIMKDDVVIEVKGKELVKHEIQDFIDVTFEKDSTVDECKEMIFSDEFTIVYTYSNGEVQRFYINSENKDTVEITDISTHEYGEKNITIFHYEQPVPKLIKFTQTIEFACHHENDDFVLIETIAPNCKYFGYEIWACNKCGKELHKNYEKGNHDYVITDGQAATCLEVGFTQEVKCSICETTFEKSEWIQALPHDYVSNAHNDYKEDELHPSSEYHYCVNGDHYEVHQYSVKEYVDEEGTLVYLYTCFCGYENPVPNYNIKTKENGQKPTVVITNGYVLNVDDEVVVYVQILNNPGFNGATFGIRYDSGLKLISYEESSIVPQQLKTQNEVYNGYNFLWASGNGNVTTEDGYLLKLTFRYIDTEKEKQRVSVVYGMSNGSNGGFYTLDDEYHMFMTQSGTISVVDHLPGDVTNNGVVDIMDATHIAWSIIGKVDENNNRIEVNAKHADVNLDGLVDLLDVLAILQSISGRYGTSLLSSQYELFFNLNGFICDEMNNSVMVKFYDDDGNRTTWSKNVEFAKYEELMKQLGYTFVGWYTRMDCTCCTCKDDKCPCKYSCIGNKDCICEEDCVRNLNCEHLVKATDFITYDKYQGNQTLYARWEKNKIVFDMGGADCKQVEDIIYSKADHANSVVELDIPVWSYDIDYIVDGKHYGNGKIYKEFLGWIDENGDPVTHIDLSVENIGTVKLIATWSEYKWTTPDITEEGYHYITDWFTDVYGTNHIDDINKDQIVVNIVNNGCRIYGNRTPIEYTITYNNTQNLANGNNTHYNITQSVELSPLPNYIGYSFAGWINEEGKTITKISEGTTGDIILTANWTANVYEVTVMGINTSKTIANRTDSKGNPIYDDDNGNYNLLPIFYTYGDDQYEKGFYADKSLTKKLTVSNFDKYLKNTQGKTHFTFGGLYNSYITDNGHTYAGYVTSSCVLSNGFVLGATPNLNENTLSGTLYALFVPKSYTITFDVNKPAYGTTSSINATKSIRVPYNESLSEHNIIMPTNTYYKSTYRDNNGVDYYGFDGKCDKVASFGENVTFTAYWGVDKGVADLSYHTSSYATIRYVTNASDLSNIRNYSGDSFVLLDNIPLEGTWTPIPSFSGKLNGNGKTISNMTIEQKAYSGNSHLYLGLFGVFNGYATNLNIEDSRILVNQGHDGEGWIFAGAVAGIVNGTLDCINVYNVHVEVHRGNSEFGGISGTCNGTIQNCGAYGITLYGNGDQGGITGGLCGTVKNCKVGSYESTRTSIKHYATNTRSIGGIVGYSNNATIWECAVENIDFTLTGEFSKKLRMGYIVGKQEGGRVYHVGADLESCTYAPGRNSSELYYGGSWWLFNSDAYDYNDYYFNDGHSAWGFAGMLEKGNDGKMPIVE